MAHHSSKKTVAQSKKPEPKKIECVTCDNCTWRTDSSEPGEGTGLIDPHTLCDKCNGTGVVEK